MAAPLLGMAGVPRPVASVPGALRALGLALGALSLALAAVPGGPPASAQSASPPAAGAQPTGGQGSGPDRSSPYGRASSPPMASHAAAPAGSYANPLSGVDFPDPSVVEDGGTYYAFATGNLDNNVSEMSTRDLGSWPQSYGALTDALPTVGTWATSSSYERVWAPAVTRWGATWLLFYSAIDTASGARCIGVATSSDAAGPYQDTNPAPLVCQPELGDSIDPDPYQATDGSLYLAWASPDEAGRPTLWSAEVAQSAGGVVTAGPPVALLHADQGWEQTVENPDMVVVGGRYLLLFSGGAYADASYATGYAVCLGPQGPCEEPADHPLLASSATVAGPGGGSVFADANGQLWLAYAAWTPPAVGYAAGGSRTLRIDPLCVAGGNPDLLGPTTTPQPLTPLCPPTDSTGYRLAAADGGVFAFGDAAFEGSTGGQPLNAPIVGMAVDEATDGYWLVAADGGVFAFDAPFFGSMGGERLDRPVVGMAASRDGGGYWLVAADGGVFAFGDAAFEGSMGGQLLDAPIVGMAPDRWTGGYWLVAADGGVFAFDAPFFGSTGGRALRAPVVTVLTAGGGLGYWLVGAGGAVYPFGAAPALGSLEGVALAAPVVGGAPDGFGDGYWLVAADGGVFAFGSAPFGGSAAHLSLAAPVVALLPR